MATFLTEQEAWKFLSDKFMEYYKDGVSDKYSCRGLCHGVLMLSIHNKILDITYRNMILKLREYNLVYTPFSAYFWPISILYALNRAELAEDFANNVPIEKIIHTPTV